MITNPEFLLQDPLNALIRETSSLLAIAALGRHHSHHFLLPLLHLSLRAVVLVEGHGDQHRFGVAA